MSYSLAVQAAIKIKLEANTTLMSAIKGVYDNVPQNEEFPYVVIGDDVATSWSDNNQNGWNILTAIHTWSRHLGRKETKQIQQLIFDSLNRQVLNVAGYKFVDCQYVDEDSFPDKDEKTRHGIMHFRVLIHQ